MAIQSTLKTGLVVGRFGVGVADGPDVGDEPDIIPASGRIVFTPMIPVQQNPTATPAPVSILRVPITAIIDSEGYVCTPDPASPQSAGAPGIRLFATDDPDSSVKNWTYRVEYFFDRVSGVVPVIETHDLALPVGSTRDLTTAAPVPSSGGYGIAQAEAAASRAEAAASAAIAKSDAAVATANGVKALADSGAFKGAKGDPGGLVMGTLIPDGADLRTYTTPGWYRKVGGTVANGPAGLRQPYFSMEVAPVEGSRLQQTIYPGATGQMGKVFWINALAGGGWSGWNSFLSGYTDGTVGRAQYQWDTLSDNYRLISGDTGEIDVTGLLLNGWAADKVILSRENNTVRLTVANLRAPTTYTSGHFIAVPTGFRAQDILSCRGTLFVDNSNYQYARTYYESGNLVIVAGTGKTAVYGTLSWHTNQPWPTATPPIA